MNTIICQKCGHSNNNSNNYCGKCAAPLQRTQKVPPPPPQAAQASQPPWPPQQAQASQPPWPPQQAQASQPSWPPQQAQASQSSQQPWTPEPPQFTALSGPQFAKVKKPNLIWRIIKIGVLSVVGFFVLLIALVVIIIIFSSNSTTTTNSSTSTSQSTSSDAASEVSVSPEELKQRVGEQDLIVWDNFMNIVTAHNQLMDGMDQYSRATISSLDFYNLCKEVEEYQAKMSLYSPPDTPDIAAEYISSIQDMALYSQITAQNLMKYLDSEATSDLTEISESIDKVKASIDVISNNRTKVLSDAGFTKAEIVEIANQIELP